MDSVEISMETYEEYGYKTFKRTGLDRENSGKLFKTLCKNHAPVSTGSVVAQKLLEKPDASIEQIDAWIKEDTPKQDEKHRIRADKWRAEAAKKPKKQKGIRIRGEVI